MKNRNRGITLIALIITIIVLLILAGVTIATLTSENGLLNRAKSAKEASLNSQIQENTTLDIYTNEVDKAIAGTNRETTTSSTIQDTVLWTGSIKNVGETATLSDSIENYKYLLLETRWSGTTSTINTILNVNTIKSVGYFLSNYSASNSHTIITMYDNFYMYISFTTSNSLIIPEHNGNGTALTKVIGIK